MNEPAGTTTISGHCLAVPEYTCPASTQPARSRAFFSASAFRPRRCFGTRLPLHAPRAQQRRRLFARRKQRLRSLRTRPDTPSIASHSAPTCHLPQSPSRVLSPEQPIRRSRVEPQSDARPLLHRPAIRSKRSSPIDDTSTVSGVRPAPEPTDPLWHMSGCLDISSDCRLRRDSCPDRLYPLQGGFDNKSLHIVPSGILLPDRLRMSALLLLSLIALPERAVPSSSAKRLVGELLGLQAR